MRRAICAILVVMLIAISVFGADFHVSTAVDLNAALKHAATNEEADIITLAPGTYTGNFSLALEDGEALTVQGAEGPNPENVILDGSDAKTVLTIVAVEEGGTMILSGITVQNGNRTNGHGGGIKAMCIDAPMKLVLKHVIVQKNMASDNGGGIELKGLENARLSVEIWDSIIRNNEAQKRGGGIDAYTWKGGSSIDILIVDSIIYGNRANWTGGGIELAASEVGENNTVHATIINTTITGNTSNMNEEDDSSGGGIRVYGYRGEGAQVVVDIYNSIVWGNASVGKASGQDLAIGCMKPGDAEVHAYHSAIGDVFVDDSLGVPVYKSEGVISADPLFVDAATGDFHLAVGSPCIDVGSTEVPLDLPDLDLDGNPRVCGTAPDLGAYEQCSE